MDQQIILCMRMKDHCRYLHPVKKKSCYVEPLSKKHWFSLNQENYDKVDLHNELMSCTTAFKDRDEKSETPIIFSNQDYDTADSNL